MHRPIAVPIAAATLSAQTVCTGWEATGMKLEAAGRYLAAADVFRVAVASAGKTTDDLAFQYWAQVTPRRRHAAPRHRRGGEPTPIPANLSRRPAAASSRPSPPTRPPMPFRSIRSSSLQASRPRC